VDVHQNENLHESFQHNLISDHTVTSTARHTLPILDYTKDFFAWLDSTNIQSEYIHKTDNTSSEVLEDFDTLDFQDLYERDAKEDISCEIYCSET
jgi:hypothetical protein